MINRLRKQKQIGKATFHFTFQFTRSAKAKPRTLTFCSSKSFTCPPDSFLPCSRCPARPTEKQSRASIIETSTIRRTNTCTFSGASANAGPHYQKLYARVTHICGNHKGQPDPSAMKGPCLERTASSITVPPTSGKLFILCGGQAKVECNANTCQPRRGTTTPPIVAQESNPTSPQARLHT